ncbi:9965_t:CDS:2 [Scutellospora calospora]|uniref:9965_t:CDS:1 n=1 Tax=Scutellospora calospora TaxID=85575 RepID=A0ACA9K815_9GLOM|nr:9965_t:CDS:2 [Scutellospora calospora]
MPLVKPTSGYIEQFLYFWRNLTNTALKSRIAQLQITNSKAEIEIEALKSKNSSLSDDLLAERSEKLSTIRSLSEQITTLLHENEKLSQAADNNEPKIEIVALKKKNLSLSDELLAERSEKLSTIRSLREQITKLLDENKKLSQAVNNNNTWHEANCDSCGLQIKGCRYKVIFIHFSQKKFLVISLLLKIIPQK